MEPRKIPHLTLLHPAQSPEFGKDLADLGPCYSMPLLNSEHSSAVLAVSASLPESDAISAGQGPHYRGLLRSGRGMKTWASQSGPRMTLGRSTLKK